MPLRSTKFLVTGLVVVSAYACRSDKQPIQADSTSAAAQSSAAVSTPPVNTGWDEAQAGPALFLPVSDNAAAASVVNPMLTDSVPAESSKAAADSLTGLSVELFHRTGLAGSARLSGRASIPPTEGCVAWPVMSLAESNQKQWQAGFRKGVVTPLPLDSLEGFSPADSMAVTTELARLASALPLTGDSAFQGLPFSVRKAYRANTNQPVLLIGDIVRKINEEANPREEHILLIAEKNNVSVSPYQTVFHSRAAGSEEQVRTTEILAAGRLVHGGQTVLVVSFGYENGSRVALIERTENSQWKITWRSAYAGC
jgi:hypothetical protein